MRRMLRAFSSDQGLTLVELGVGMAITAMLSTILVTWLGAAVGSETSHRSYDEALADLRHVTDQMSREIRTSNGLTAIADQSLSLWLDTDRDGVVDTGEIVSWAIEGTTMVRWTDDAVIKAVVATNISESASGFGYDSTDPTAVTRVTVDLVAVATTRAGEDPLQHSVDVYLRNT